MKAVTELLQLMEKVLSMVLVLLVIMLALEKKTNLKVFYDRSVLFCVPRIFMFAPEEPVVR